MSGEVLRSKNSKQEVVSISRGLSGGSENEDKQEKENDIFSKELEQDAIKGFSIRQSKDFNVIKYPFLHDEEDINELITAEVIRDYTKDVEYTLKRNGTRDTPKLFQIKPDAKEINLTAQLVYANKCYLEFESQGFRYIRTISDNRGKIIFDNR